MEPISYLRAPIRRWPAVVATAIIAMIIAMLIPVGSGSGYPANTWRANAVVGLTPAYKLNGLASKLGIKQLEYYSTLPAVITAAANADGVPVTHSLKSDVVVAKNKQHGTAGSTLLVAVLQPSAAQAASLTNAFVASLSSYAQAQLVAQNKKQIAQQETYIANLEKAIASLPLKTKAPGTTPTTTPTTRPPTVKIKKKVVVTKPPTSGLQARPSSAELTAFVAASPQTPIPTTVGSAQAVLVDTTTSTSTTVSTTTTTLVPGAVGSTSAGSTTQTTQNLNKQATQTENRALADSLAQATAHLAKLQADGVSPTGLKVVSPARQKNAVLLSTSSLLSNVWLRALLGLLIGALLGVVITWILDAFDRRLRTSKRAEEVFGLPVIVEIPAPSARSASPVPVVDIVVDPYSPASEAYRRLHVAILTAPAVTWVKRGFGLRDDFFELPPRPQELLVGAAAPGATAASPVVAGASPSPGGASDEPGETPTPPMGLPVPIGNGDLVVPRRKRFSILVTSATDEPTRSLVIVNLAAVFAEAGDRVLVATTGGLRTAFDGTSQIPTAWDAPNPANSAADLVSNARPSAIPGVSSLALGQLYAKPSRLALNAPGLVEAARDVVDVVLFEAPLLSTQDGTALLPAVDLVVVVCEAWHTTVAEGLRSQRLLAQFRPPVLGLVMTNMEVEHPSLSGSAAPI